MPSVKHYKPSAEINAIVRATLERTPISSLLDKREAVVLERIACGAGSTYWYYCADQRSFETIKLELQPGSLVSFYFDGRLKKALYSKEVKEEILKIAEAEHDAVIGRLTDDGIHIEVDFVSGTADLDEFILETKPSTPLIYGSFPGRDNDGVHAITVQIPDSDGVTRKHSY